MLSFLKALFTWVEQSILDYLEAIRLSLEFQEKLKGGGVKLVVFENGVRGFVEGPCNVGDYISMMYTESFLDFVAINQKIARIIG